MIIDKKRKTDTRVSRKALIAMFLIGCLSLPVIGGIALVGCAQEKPPTIVSIDPVMVSATGGTEITITGTGFKATPFSSIAPTVTIGGNPATGVRVIAKTSLKATVPPGVAGSADVVVTNAKAKVRSLPFKGFTYYEDVNVVSSIPDFTNAPPEGIKAPSKVTLTFNQDVDPASVVIRFIGDDGVGFAGTTGQDKHDSKMFTFTPNKPFKSGNYRLVVSGAKGIAAGNVMAPDYTVLFKVRGKAEKKSIISRSDIITRTYLPGFLSASDDGYAWKKATKDERMRLCKAFESINIRGKFDATWYYRALNEFYNTSESAALETSISQAVGLVYALGTHGW